MVEIDGKKAVLVVARGGAPGFRLVLWRLMAVIVNGVWSTNDQWRPASLVVVVVVLVDSKGGWFHGGSWLMLAVLDLDDLLRVQAAVDGGIG